MENISFIAKYKQWFIGGSILVASAIIASLLIMTAVKANADYICTHIVEENGECSNGAWGAWQPVSSADDENTCTRTIVQRRTYTGTRTTKHILTYLNLRTACQAGYSQAGSGEGGGASGNQGRGGHIITETAACQINETQTSRSAYTADAGRCRNTNTATTTQTQQPVVTTTVSGFDSGTTQSTQAVGSVSQLDQFRASMISAKISATPQLVRPGQSTVIKWQGREVTECAITGTNGDGTGDNEWSGIAGEEISRPITEPTTYTMTCIAFNGATTTSTVLVSLAPQWNEQQ